MRAFSGLLGFCRRTRLCRDSAFDHRAFSPYIQNVVKLFGVVAKVDGDVHLQRRITVVSTATTLSLISGKESNREA